MKIAFVGSIVDENEVAHMPAVSVAGNKMQIGILRGLYNQPSQIEGFSVKPYEMWKGKGKCIIKGEKTQIDEEIELKHVFFVNILFAKQITIWISVFFNLFIWCLKNFKDTQKIVMVYNTISYIASPTLIISKIFKCKSVFIVADVPIQNESKKLMQKMEDNKEIALIKKCDLLIPLTDAIATDFGNKQPYIVIEAGQEKKFIKDSNPKRSSNSFNIVFSGSLNEVSGIELAIETMNIIDDDSIKLNIYGKGSMEGYVIKASKSNPNIIFHGTVTNNKMMEIQRNSDLLICPRVPDDFVTKYTFPSKIVEYMSAGVPVLSNKLIGIPKEYYSYISALDSADKYLWAKTIKSISENNNDKYQDKAINARKFIYDNKIWEVQTSRILNFLRNNF